MMTHQEIQNSVDELVRMVEDGKTLEAFDKFYHDDFIGQENQTEARIGKAANRDFEENFVGNVETVRKYQAVSTVVGSNVSVIAWEIDIDHKEWGAVKMTELNLQRWEDGKIIHESYNYNP